MATINHCAAVLTQFVDEALTARCDYDGFGCLTFEDVEDALRWLDVEYAEPEYVDLEDDVKGLASFAPSWFITTDTDIDAVYFYNTEWEPRG